MYRSSSHPTPTPGVTLRYVQSDRRSLTSTSLYTFPIIANTTTTSCSAWTLSATAFNRRLQKQMQFAAGLCCQQRCYPCNHTPLAKGRVEGIGGSWFGSSYVVRSDFSFTSCSEKDRLIIIIIIINHHYHNIS